MYSNTTWYVIIRSKPLTGVVAGRFPELKTTIRNAQCGGERDNMPPSLPLRKTVDSGGLHHQPVARAHGRTRGHDAAAPTFTVICPGQASEKQLQRLSRICCLCCRHLWCMLPPQPIREKGMMFIYSRPAQCPFVSSCVAH